MRSPIGISDFKELIQGNYLFADKSLFVKDVIEDGAKVILIPRPRRFGKTLNLSMLYYFLGQNHYKEESEKEKENLFENLKIAEDIEFCQKHQGQYPIIFITFKDINASSYDRAYHEIVELIRRLYEEHRYLLEGDALSENEKAIFNKLLNEEADESKIKGALVQLCLYMVKKHNKLPIILIDEYDTPIQEGYLREYYPKIVELMRGIFGQALKDNQNLAKAVITGISRISQESLFSGLNNLAVYTLLREKFGQYFGFTEEEVGRLLTESKQPVSMVSITEWYNGYQAGKYTLYNPWSIINCLDNHGALQPYWVNTSSNELINKLLSNAKPLIKQQFEKLLQGDTIERPLSENLVFQDLENSEDALWNLLFYTGYLKVLSLEFSGRRFMARIAIPNKEVSLVYDKIVEQWFDKAISLDSYDKFVQSLADGSMDKFKEYLSSYIMQTGSYFDFNKNSAEQIFHVFILGLVVGLRDAYIVYSNQESGLGRLDAVFIPKKGQKNGILLEFKTSVTVELLLPKAQEALEQIKDKQYAEIFKGHNVTSITAIGLAFCGKQMELVHETINLSSG